MFVKLSTFVLFLAAVYKLSDLVIPFVSPIASWLLLITISWKSSHLIDKHLILSKFFRKSAQHRAVLITGTIVSIVTLSAISSNSC